MSEHDPIVAAETDEQSALVADALQKLTSRQRRAIKLRFEDGLSFAKVADGLDITPAGARQLVGRACTSLRRLLPDSLVDKPELDPQTVLRKLCGSAVTRKD